MKSPNHIAIIMDGNGRWGLKKYKDRLIGHKFGAKNIKLIINFCLNNKIKYLTLFALSFNNLQKRGKKEIDNIFSILKEYITNNEKFFKEHKININFIGESKKLPTDIKRLLTKFKNKKFLKKTKMQVNVALNYSSKLEISYALKKIIKLNKIPNQNNISKYLYTKGIQEPEILIRTGGYTRLSDFLLWQCSYSEIFFSKKLWPDFKSNDLRLIIQKYKKIKRNFGS